MANQEKQMEQLGQHVASLKETVEEQQQKAHKYKKWALHLQKENEHVLLRLESAVRL